jgi:hypothetical protein
MSVDLLHPPPLHAFGHSDRYTLTTQCTPLRQRNYRNGPALLLELSVCFDVHMCRPATDYGPFFARLHTNM